MAYVDREKIKWKKGDRLFLSGSNYEYEFVCTRWRSSKNGVGRELVFKRKCDSCSLFFETECDPHRFQDLKKTCIMCGSK